MPQFKGAYNDKLPAFYIPNYVISETTLATT